jgi:hypothetical protein
VIERARSGGELRDGIDADATVQRIRSVYAE